MKPRLLLDTNVVIDFLNQRDPFYEKARLLMIIGNAGEFDLWMSSSQITDLIYIVSDGGKKALRQSTLERIRGLRTFINVFAVGEDEIDRMLVSAWNDPEDALLFEVALSIKADAIITRNKTDFETSLIKVMDCEELFHWLEVDHGITYDEVAL